MQRNFLRGLLICLIPTVLFGAAAVFGTYRKGIDLAGGTILVYEVDLSKNVKDKKDAADGDAEGRGLSSEDMHKLAESLKRRIDPVDTRNVIIRPVGGSRIEILVPFTPTAKKQAGTEDFVQEVKDLVSRVGVLEFRILANDTDDKEGFEEALDTVNNQYPPEQAEKDAKFGEAPPVPRRSDYHVSINGTDASNVKYEWIELGKEERNSLGLSNSFGGAEGGKGGLWMQLAAQRGKAVSHNYSNERGERASYLLFSRPFTKVNPAKEEVGKEVEYFILTRVSDQDQVKVGGDINLNAFPESQNFDWAVGFQFNGAGSAKFGQVTNRNRPTANQTVRHLAVLLDNKVMSAPQLNSQITGKGQISGKFTKESVDRLVYILKSGALTAELKPNPVSENSVGATLGEDTKNKGLLAVGLSFGAVMLFMMGYYRFAGIVACVALLINLLLTIGFMVAVNAAFTLAGLAGIVLMLGMAVDANVLIYERLREEREKGATLAAALRAGYDRALPTIIDTHVSSIFTAIVLFVFGNDNLKGFAVSLTVGLIISLFTSLYVTRLIFDYWQSRRWLRELKMMRLFARPNINFMRIRHAMFAVTAILTVAGLGLFLARGDDVLNVDFRGGTVYGGRLAEATGLSTAGGKTGLLDLLSEKRQAERLKVTDAREVTTQGKTDTNTWEIFYAGDPKPAVVTFANKPAGKDDVIKRAEKLPDVSAEQVKVNAMGDDQLPSGESKSFTIRTTEKEKDLVQVMLDRLLRDDNGQPLMDLPKLEKWETTDATTKLFFSKPASVSYVQSLLKRVFHQKSREPLSGSSFVLSPVYSADGTPDRDREAATSKFTAMTLDVSGNTEFAALKEAIESHKTMSRPVVMAAVGSFAPAVLNSPKAEEERAAIDGILTELKTTVESRPVPDRLETFDAGLAKETQSRALFAIVASWIAILLYLWFRFGSWTFGLAAVFCLIHDLCFTLGAIAICHYLHAIPALGTLFQIQDYKIDLAAVAALLTLVGYSVNDTIVVFDRIREVRGKNPLLTEQMINDSVNQTLSRTVLASLTVFLVVGVLYWFGGDGVHLFAFVMVVGVIIGTYSSIYVAAPLLLLFGEGKPKVEAGETTTGTLAKV
ncbi:protein translocase subunit SecD [Limnoglobus roseus]|uniref:Multifunctional fusion protein n=1 Tax=Limnoglobus roseus TaxID=2598579 RepID=A0A5C1A4V0_9BACT|nr:protein translocase subunit SecD [Limnoglobus roseus]QEL14131.1 protein translocase subunit SecD [Limnoglobus roseus]